jgi:hypothetical protein
MSTLPTYDLQLRAEDQRRRLKGSFNELRERVREKLDVKRTARRHVILASAIAAVMSLAAGYGMAGLWMRN